MGNQEIICIQSTAFYSLIDEVLHHLQQKLNLSKEPDWVDTQTAMDILNIRSRTTIQSLRDEGKIVFSTPTKKGVLYHRQSLLDYIQSSAQKTF